MKCEMKLDTANNIVDAVTYFEVSVKQITNRDSSLFPIWSFHKIMLYLKKTHNYKYSSKMIQ